MPRGSLLYSESCNLYFVADPAFGAGVTEELCCALIPSLSLELLLVLVLSVCVCLALSNLKWDKSNLTSCNYRCLRGGFLMS